MPTPLLRPATMADADFLAQATLAASRSHLPSAYFDSFFPVPDARLLALLARVQLHPARGWGHWTEYQVLESRPVETPAPLLGAICASPANTLPDFPFPAVALREAGTALGWSPAELDTAQDRIDLYLQRLEDIVLSNDAETLFVQFLYVPRPHRRQGHARRMMEAVTAQARAAGRQRLELFTDMGNTPAEMLYASLGFVLVDEYHYHDFPPQELARIGPGVRRWQREIE
ncbi:GNAT family N-acetyltransferase [Megalodesulfovibrio paquesii]